MADERFERFIAGIIGVIDRIAFQTNILALNAAVEAALAGEIKGLISAAAAESLSGQAARLVQAVRVFTLTQGEPRAAAV